MVGARLVASCLQVENTKVDLHMLLIEEENFIVSSFVEVLVELMAFRFFDLSLHQIGHVEVMVAVEDLLLGLLPEADDGHLVLWAEDRCYA